MSEQLVGRSKAFDQILGAAQQVSSGKFHICLVEGQSGIGKTFLIRRVLDTLQRQGYFYGYAKLQPSHSQPYHAAGQLIRSLLHSIFSSDPEAVSRIRTRMQIHEDESRALVSSIISESLGSVTSMAEENIQSLVDPRKAFASANTSLLSSLASPEHPVILVIDGVQWLDADTLFTIEESILGREIGSVLLVLLYRESAWTDNPYAIQLLQRSILGTEVTRVSIGPWNNHDVASFLLQSHPSLAAASQSELNITVGKILEATHGIPFEILEIKRQIDAEKNYTKMNGLLLLQEWQSHTQGNTAEHLLLASFYQLPQPLQLMLNILSRYGGRMPTKLMELELNALGNMGLEACLSDPRSKTWIKKGKKHLYFAHDRYQEFVCTLLTGEEKVELDSRISRFVIQLCNEGSLEQSFLNHIIDHVVVNGLAGESGFKFELILELIYRNAEEVIRTHTAIGIIEQAEYLLRTEPGKKPLSYESRRKLSQVMLAAQQACVSLKKYDKADYFYKQIQQLGLKDENLLTAHAKKIHSLIATQDMATAVELAEREVTREGYPLKIQPTAFNLVKALLKSSWRLRGKRFQKYVPAQRSADPISEALMRIVSDIAPAAFYINSNNMVLLIEATLEIAVKRKLYEVMPVLLAGYAFFIQEVGLRKRSRQIAEYSLQLLSNEKVFPYIHSRTILIAFNNVLHHYNTLEYCLSQIRPCYRKAISTGDEEFAAQALCFSTYLGFHAGENLKGLLIEADRGVDLVSQMTVSSVSHQHRIYTQTIYNLVKATPLTTLDFKGPFYTANDTDSAGVRERDQSSYFDYYLCSSVLNYLFDRPRAAFEFSSQISLNTEGAEGCCTHYVYYMFRALILADSISMAPVLGNNLYKLKREFKTILKALHRYTQRAPHFILSKYLIVRGVSELLKGKADAALKTFEGAYEEAIIQKRTYEAYIATRLQVRLLLKQDRPIEAIKYAERSLGIASDWGAQSLTKHLELVYSRIPQFRDESGINELKTIRVPATILGQTSVSRTISSLCEQIVERFYPIELQAEMINGSGAFEKIWSYLANELKQNISQRPDLGKVRALIYYTVNTGKPERRNQGSFGYPASSESNAIIAESCIPIIANGKVKSVIYSRMEPQHFDSYFPFVTELLEQIKDHLDYLARAEQVEASEKQLRSFCDESTAGMMSFSTSGNLLFANRLALSWHGYTSFELMVQEGKNAFASEWTSRFDLSTVLETITAQHAPSKLERKITIRNGSGLPITVLLNATRGEGERVDILLTDISLQVSIEEERHLRKQAEYRFAESERQVALLSHELKTPINMILAPARYILTSDAELSEKTRQNINYIVDNSLRLMKVVNDLLWFIHLDTDAIALEKCPINLVIEVRKLIDRVAPYFSAHGKTLTYLEPHEDYWILADLLSVERILYNLLTNAHRYTGAQGRIQVEVARSGQEIIVAIADNGIGINPEDLDRVFDRYYRGQRGKSHSAQGLGLGLSVVKELVEMNDARVELESSPGRGTSVTIRFNELTTVPEVVSRGQNPEDDQQIHEMELSFFKTQIHLPSSADNEAVSSDSVSEARPAILIIDDELQLNQFLAELFSEFASVTSFFRGDEGLEEIHAKPYDLILLDIGLPGMSGLEVLEALYNEGTGHLVPPKVIMLSAHSDREQINTALSLGALDFIPKPFDPVEARKRVQNALESINQEKRLRHSHIQLKQAYLRLQEAEIQIINNEKNRVLSDVASGLLHEINNPLNVTLNALLMMRDEKLPEQVIELIDDALESQEQIASLISDMRGFAQPQNKLTFQLTKLKDLFEASIRYLRHELIEIKVNILLDDSIEAKVSRNLFLQVAINLISNAARAIQADRKQEGGEISVKGRYLENDLLEISIEDNGIGISESQLSQVFEPFYTGYGTIKGTGLGLSLVRFYLEKHGGSVRIESQEGLWTRVFLTLPKEGPEHL